MAEREGWRVKLVRDDIPDVIRLRGGDPIIHTATTDEYKIHLRQKLVEEAGEAFEADDGHLPEELADVLQVITSIAIELGLDLDDINRMRMQKAEKFGTFTKRIIWEGNR